MVQVYKTIVLYFLSITFGDIYGLDLLPLTKGNDIVMAGTAIRRSVNSLLNFFDIAPEKVAKLEQFLRIHNYFLTLSHQDYHNLNRIEYITRVPENSNVTTLFMKTINNILNENIGEQFKFETLLVDDSPAKINKFEKDVDVFTTLHENNTANPDEGITFDNDIKDILTAVGSDSNKILDDVVGPSRRIFRSKKTKIRNFPFTGAIQVFGAFFCAGSIISDDLVITAASCLQLSWNNRHFRENYAHVTVRVGSSFPMNGGENIGVSEIFFNPTYNPRTLQGNIAILRLERRLNFQRSKKVRKIDFDRNPTQIPYSTAGVTIIGWGSKNIGNKIETRRYLQYDTLGIMSWHDCLEIYTSNYLKMDNICIGYVSEQGGACNHDVGDPGVVDGILVGIVSFASPVCGQANAPTVLTKLGYYTDWIEEIIAVEAPMQKMLTTKVDSSKEDFSSTTKRMKYHPVAHPKPIPYYVRETLLKYFNDDSDLYKRFLKTCDDVEVQDFASALRGDGLQLPDARQDKAKSKINY